MTTRTKIVLALAAVLLLAAGAFVASRLEFVEVERDLGPSLLARRDPLLATRRLLERLGHVVESSEAIARPAAADGVAFVALSARSMPPTDAQAWRAWVERGGRLVLLLPYGGARRKTLDRAIERGRYALPIAAALGLEVSRGALEEVADERGDDDAADAAEGARAQRAQQPRAARDERARDEAAHAPFDAEHVRVAGFGGDVSDVAVPADARRLAWSDKEPDAWAAARSGAWMAGYALGEGRLFVIADDAWLSNAGLGEAQNASLVAALASGRERVVLSRAEHRASLLEWCVRSAGVPLGALLAAIGVWIWMRSRRFGPLLPEAVGSERSFLEHLEACGEFSWRRRERDEQLEPLRRALRRHVERRRPDLVGADMRRYVDEVAERNGLEAAAVAEAHGLAREPAADGARESERAAVRWTPNAFVRAVRTLLNARND